METHQGFASAAPKDFLNYQVTFWVTPWTDDGKLRKFRWPEGQECGEELKPITEEDNRTASSQLHQDVRQPRRVAPETLQSAGNEEQNGTGKNSQHDRDHGRAAEPDRGYSYGVTGQAAKRF